MGRWCGTCVLIKLSSRLSGFLSSSLLMMCWNGHVSTIFESYTSFQHIIRKGFVIYKNVFFNCSPAPQGLTPIQKIQEHMKHVFLKTSHLLKVQCRYTSPCLVVCCGPSSVHHFVARFTKSGCVDLCYWLCLLCLHDALLSGRATNSCHVQKGCLHTCWQV